MLTKTRLIVLGAGLTVAGMAIGATITSAVSPAALTANSTTVKVPAVQSGRYVFACVNPAGGIDYLEFRQPLPHQCWFAGESLWYWDAVPLAVAPTPTPTPSPSPSPTPTPAKPVIANVETAALTYQAKTPAVAITAALALSDSDDATMSSATVSITSGFSSGNDTLSFVNGSGITGSYVATTGVLTLSGSASLADYQAALRSVEFSTTDPAASPAARTVSFTVTDSLGATSNTAARTIDVTAAG